MKLTVLVDNNSWGPQAEWGLSILIEDEEKKILFDVGSTDLFLKNAQRLNRDLLNVDYLVFSHGHHDHTRGLPHLISFYESQGIGKENRPELIAHLQALHNRRNSFGHKLGIDLSDEELRAQFRVALQKEPKWLTEKLVFLGEIQRNTDYEAKEPMGEIQTENGWEPDFILDDTGLAYKSTEGLVIIVGCSHSGICNIVEQAKRICEDDRILDIVGGFHLLNPQPEQLTGTIQYIKELQPKALHACHCIDLPSKIALAGVSDLQEVGTGLELEYNK